MFYSEFLEAGQLAQRRLARGLRLNHPEAGEGEGEGGEGCGRVVFFVIQRSCTS